MNYEQNLKSYNEHSHEIATQYGSVENYEAAQKAREKNSYICGYRNGKKDATSNFGFGIVVTGALSTLVVGAGYLLSELFAPPKDE